MRAFTMRTAAAVAAGTLMLGVAGCAAPGPEPTGTEPTGTGTSTPADPPSAARTATAASLVIPDCAQLVPIEQVQQYEIWQDVVLIQTMEGTGIAAELPGPVARGIALSAQQNRGCLLGVPQSDAAVGVYTLQIPTAARDELIEELRADDAFAQTDVRGAPSFAIQTEEGLGGTTISYTFTGTAWLILRGGLIDPETASRIAGPAVASLRAANPEGEAG